MQLRNPVFEFEDLSWFPKVIREIMTDYQVDSENYLWKAGKIKSKYGMRVTYLIGHPC